MMTLEQAYDAEYHSDRRQTLDEYDCHLGHFDCSFVDGGPCLDEARHLIEAADRAYSAKAEEAHYRRAAQAYDYDCPMSDDDR